MSTADYIADLLAAVPGLAASTEPATLRAYSRDCWPIYQIRYWQRPVESIPGIIVRPRQTGEVQAVYRFAAARGIPVAPVGLGSGVCGGAVPETDGIVLDLRLLDHMLELDRESNLAKASVGWNGQILEDRLNALGFTAGHFPSSIMMSSLGGWMAARGAGQLSTRYGKFEDRLRGVRWVYPDGSEEWLDSNGFREGVLELLAGSEGTLGTATEVEFRVDPLAESRTFGAYDFSSVESALTSMQRLMHAGLRPAVVRLYDPIDSLLHAGFRRGIAGAKQAAASGGVTVARRDNLLRQTLRQALRLVLDRPAAAQSLLERLSRKCLLIVMFEGPAASVSWQTIEADKILRQGGTPLGEGPARAWYAKRYSITGKQSDILKMGGFFDTMEVAFPWSRLAEGYRAVRAALQGQVLLMAHFSHVYADGGCIYFTFTGYKPEPLANERHYLEVWRLALNAVVGAGGTITHHHGVGLLKARWMADEWQGGHGFLRLLKNAIDPHHIANPGKLGL